jgi:hypothetical protein
MTGCSIVLINVNPEGTTMAEPSRSRTRRERETVMRTGVKSESDTW